MSGKRYDTTSLVDDGSSHLLLQTGRTIRDNLHTLTGLSLFLLIVALPWFVIASLTSWLIVWIPLMLTTAPIWATMIAAADQMLEGNAVTLPKLATLLQRHSRSGFEIAILPALAGTLLLGTIAALNQTPGNAWMMMPVALGFGLSLATSLLLVPAFNVATRSGDSMMKRWQASAYITATRPTEVVGTLVLGGMVLWLAAGLGPAALLLLGPLAVLICAVTRPNPT